MKQIIHKQIDKDQLFRFFPGILLKVGDYYPSKRFLKEMINENRKFGIKGEVYFFYEGLKKYPNFFRDNYKDKAVFPDLLN
jgi:hypothetical protein